MSNELLTVIEYLSQSRSISREIIVKALENAILSASRKSIHPASDLRIKIDPPTGKIQAIAILEVVDGVPMNSDQITIAAGGHSEQLRPYRRPGCQTEPHPAASPCGKGKSSGRIFRPCRSDRLRQCQ